MTRRLLLLFVFLSLAPAALAGEDGYRVIVHPEVDTKHVDRTFVRDAFLKKRTRWPGDIVIRPVDLDEGSTARRKFTEDVLGRSVSAVKSYWQMVLFSGRDVPPPELDADAKIVEYVQKHAGAIGYVSAKADVTGVKVVAVE